MGSAYRCTRPPYPYHASGLVRGYRSAIDFQLAETPGVPDGVADTARGSVANALAVAEGAGAPAGALIRAAQESFVDGWHWAMWAGFAVLVALFVHVVARAPRNSSAGRSTDEPPTDDTATR